MIADPMTWALNFSTIIQHLSALSTGRDVAKTAKLVELYGELVEAGHQDIVENIKNNQKTLIFIKALLHRQFNNSEENIVKALTKLYQASEENITKLFERLDEQNDEQFCLLIHQIHSSVEELGDVSAEKLDKILASINRASVELFPEVIHQLSFIGKQLNFQTDSICQVNDRLDEACSKLDALEPKPYIPKPITLDIPRLDPKKIIGRDVELKTLRELLSRQENVALVNGMGGIGKTALAQAYLSRYWDEYHHIAWFQQQTDDFPSDVISNTEIFDNLTVDKHGDSETLFKGVMNAIRRIEAKPNLLVIDDARDSLAQWVSVLPPHEQWHVLLTSRKEINGFHRFLLDFLSPSAAIELFKQHYTRNMLSDEDISQLVAAVDCHTLTIELLAKVAQYRRTPADKLLQALNQDLHAGVKVNHQKKGMKVDRILSYLVNIFNADDVNDSESWLLTQFICLPSDFHKFETLFDLINVEESAYAVQFPALLIDLKSRGWLIENTDTDSYKMHQVIQAVLASQLDVQLATVKPLVEKVTKYLSINQTKDNPAHKFQWIPFGKKLLELFELKNSKEVSILENNLAIVLRDLGDYEGAKALLEKALTSDLKVFGEDHLNVARDRNNLGLVCQEIGEYDKAVSYHELVLKSDLDTFGDKHPYVARDLINLGINWQTKGYFDKALGYFERALKSHLDTFGENHPDVAIDRNNLGLIWLEKGNYQKALSYFELALESDLRIFGEAHPNVATVRNNIGQTFLKSSNLEKALCYCTLAYKSDLKSFGELHPAVVRDLTNLGLIWKGQGNFDKAISCFDQALKSHIHTRGELHPLVATVRTNLGVAWKSKGEYDKAISFCELALESDVKNFGKMHPSVARDCTNLAGCYWAKGDYDKAYEICNRALKINRSLFGDNHPDVVNCYNNLGVILSSNGAFRKALYFFGKASSINTKLFGKDHPVTLNLYKRIKSIRDKLTSD